MIVSLPCRSGGILRVEIRGIVEVVGCASGWVCGVYAVEGLDP